ncbi:MAG: hypothetical protein R2796_05485 [Chitinophagaceae bacterium]|nr:hypothetical protein [Chitinophagaceae bacterium]HQV06800.1 hypothetical protein [Chitinophagaceae bacterium]
MRFKFILFLLLFGTAVQAQEERDTTLRTCPISITDTVSNNNYFIAALPSILKVYRVKGKLTVAVEQRSQYFSLYFHAKNLKSGTYKFKPGSRKNKEIEGIYSFKSGEQASYISVSEGTVEVSFDSDKKLWHLRIDGLIANLVQRHVSYFKAYGDLYLKD